MISPRWVVCSLLAAFLITEAAEAQPREPNGFATTRRRPESFGIDSYTVTTISATAFYPGHGCCSGTNWEYGTEGSTGRYGNTQTVTEFYATLDLPAGAVIDYIGLNSNTDVAFAYGVNLISRHSDGSQISIGTFSSTPHSWDTDFNLGAIGYVWQGKSGDALIINVEEGFNPSSEYFGWVEVWWRRSVSPPPATASFNDVPTSHPFFQFVEALKASGITGGCSASPPLYCPDNPLTRGQMAVFLSKALGLDWPGN